MGGGKKWIKKAERVARKCLTLLSNQIFNLLEREMHAWEVPEMIMTKTQEETVKAAMRFSKGRETSECGCLRTLKSSKGPG